MANKTTGLMRFRLSTMLLLIALVAVSVGWYADRLNRSRYNASYLSAIVTPVDGASFARDETIVVEADFLDGNMYKKTVGDKPVFVVELMGASDGHFVIFSSFAGHSKPYVTIVPGHPERYKLRCELKSLSALFPEGKYILRVGCMVNGKRVVSPSSMITIRDPQKGKSSGGD